MAFIELHGRRFSIAPNIGHCIELQTRGVDLLGVGGEAQLEKLIANPVDFMTVLEVLIADQVDDDDAFRMPKLASCMTGAKWVEVRKVAIEAILDFFLEGGYPQSAAALERFREVAEKITKQVAESLNSGELRKRLDEETDRVIQDLTRID